MELIYELNLPSADHIFLETFKGFNDDDILSNYQYRVDIENILRPEWTTFRNIPWDYLLYFKKDNIEGRIHTDIAYADLTTPLGANSTPWGLTWVYGGDGIQEYWDFKDVISGEVTSGSNNNNKGVVKTYTSVLPPTKSYSLYKDKCYLVSGRNPHKATGFPGRRVISLRSTKLTNHVNWNKIVALFQDLIK